MKNLGNISAAVLALISGAVAVVSCEKTSEAPQADSISVSLRTSEGMKGKSGVKEHVFLDVSSNTGWKLEVRYDDEQTGWASLSATEGSGDESSIWMTYGYNGSGKDRALYVIATCGEKKDSAYFIQRSYEPSHSDTPDKVRGWLELPKMSGDNPPFYFHDMTVGGRTYRNYSFYWDKESMVAWWVAYPMFPAILYAGGRTDAWGTLDPKITEKNQPNLRGAYRGGYDRGHQCPSADRSITGSANVQTFYGTNMTPQIGSLNQRGWAQLEGCVRSWTTSFDTLYVCTGCILGSGQWAYDNDDKPVAVPKAYYKALLGLNRPDHYEAIAFYYPHEAYNGDCMQKAMTVKELEEKIAGEKGAVTEFFTNLPLEGINAKKTCNKAAWAQNNFR